jgi:hypothetical protein
MISLSASMRQAVLLSLALWGSCQAAELTWYKGNTHTHTFWSDGGEFPETVADTYRQKGYHFLALSDHNVLSQGERWITYADKKATAVDEAMQRTSARWGADHLQVREKDGRKQVRLLPLNEVRKLVEQPGRFIMIESEELTSGVAQGKQVHSNALNIDKRLPVKPKKENTVEQELAAHQKLVHGYRQGVERPVFWSINHPNYQSSLTAKDLVGVNEANAVEIMNTSATCFNNGNGKDLIPVEKMWDEANTARLQQGLAPLYGMAADDTHKYDSDKPVLYGPGLAWVMVHSPALTAEAITAAMQRGDFYCSTGITLETVDFDRQAGTLTIAVTPEAGRQYTIEFIGCVKTGAGMKTGQILQTTAGVRAVYKLQGTELFVRAVVRCDAPPVIKYDDYMNIEPKAWTQPVGWRK